MTWLLLYTARKYVQTVRNCWIFKCTFLIDTITGSLFRQPPQLQHFLPNDLVLHQWGVSNSALLMRAWDVQAIAWVCENADDLMSRRSTSAGLQTEWRSHYIITQQNRGNNSCTAFIIVFIYFNWCSSQLLQMMFIQYLYCDMRILVRQNHCRPTSLTQFVFALVDWAVRSSRWNLANCMTSWKIILHRIDSS